MGNKPSSTDCDAYYATPDSSPRPMVRSKSARLAKNRSLSALTAMAKHKLTSSSAKLDRRSSKPTAPQSAKLERSNRFSRSITSSAIHHHNNHNNSPQQSAKQQPVNSSTDSLASQTLLTADGAVLNQPLLSGNNKLSSALLDSEYFVAPASRSSVKRLAERRPAMGTNAKSSAALMMSSNQFASSMSTSQNACAPAEQDDQKVCAPLANALEATLTSLSAAEEEEDESFLTAHGGTLAHLQGSVTNPSANHPDLALGSLRQQDSNRSLAWSVTNSSSLLQTSSQILSTNLAEQTLPSSSMPAAPTCKPGRTGSTSSSTSGAASPASSITTSAPEFGAAVLERMLASLANTPTVENVQAFTAKSSVSSSSESDDDSRPLHPNQGSKNVPWDTFYTTCPWSYDIKKDQQQQQQQQQQEEVTLARPESVTGSTVSNLSNDGGSITPQQQPIPETTPISPPQSLQVNPREVNRNSCGADSGLGGMDLAAFSSQMQTETLPAVVDEDPTTPQMAPRSIPTPSTVAPQPRLVPRTVVTSNSGSSNSGSSTGSGASDRCDLLDDMVSVSCGQGGGAPSVSESLMTHADDQTVVEHGATTKRTGWLNVKNYMVRRRDRLEMAPRRRWSRYWTCLKSSVLLLYSPPDSSNETGAQDQTKTNGSVNAKHFIVIEEVLCQPLPEHPKRDNCFSLSTTSGDVFLLQADSLVDRDAWIASIHAACALALTSQPTIPSAMRVLRTEVGRLDQAVLHQRRALDAKIDGAMSSQQSCITEWESLLLTSFVLRTYLASLQQQELPNPKTLLAQVSPQTKAVLRKIGAFTVSALHAIVSARGLMRSEDVLAQQQQPVQVLEEKPSNPQSARTLLHTPDGLEIQSSSQASTQRIPVRLPSGQQVVFEWPPASSSTSLPPTTPTPKAMPGAGVTHTKASNILKHLCSMLTQPSLSAPDHFLMARFKGEEEFRIVDRNEVLLLNVVDFLVVEPRSVVRIDLQRPSLQEQFGIEVESELDSDGCAQPQDELMRVFVSRVDADARGAISGIQVGDEILVINNRLVANLTMVDIEQFFEQCLNVRLTLRVARRRCDLPKPRASTPLDLQKSSSKDDLLVDLGAQQQQVYEQNVNRQISSSDMKNKQEEIIPRPAQRKPSLTDTQKLYRAFRELIETEYAYIRDVRHLLDVYLAPLRDRVFPLDDNLAALFDAAADVYAFQLQFAQSLDDAFHLLPSFRGHHQAADLLMQPQDFRKPLLTLAAAFRCYAAKFKLYSSFSVRHSKCSQMLQDAGSNALYNQLMASANPSQQHSTSLESYLIKPIQRLLRYPLILDQLCQLAGSSFSQAEDQSPAPQLGDASRIMAMVAEHVNELQKIFDEFGCLFDQVVTEYRQAFPSVPLIFGSGSQRAELNIADLEMYGHVEWLENPTKPSRKGREIYSICFVFTEALVIVCKERTKQKGSNSAPKTPKFNASKSSPETSSPLTEEESVHYQRLLPLIDVSLRIPPAPLGFADQTKHPLWQVVYRIPTSRVSSPSTCVDFPNESNEVVFTFANSSFENKQEFVTTITQLLRQVKYPTQEQQKVQARRSQQQKPQQRSRSVGRLQHQKHNFDDCYDLQPVGRAPPLPPRGHHLQNSQQQQNNPHLLPVPRADGSTSSGGQSDSLNSSIGSINGQPTIIGHRQSQQLRVQTNQQQSAKLLFMSPAGSSASSSNQSQQQNVRKQTSFDPQSSPVWKPRGLPEQQPTVLNQVQQPALPLRQAVKTSTQSFLRSKSPANERLYWHDSEVTIYNHKNSQYLSQLPVPPTAQQHQQQQLQQQARPMKPMNYHHQHQQNVMFASQTQQQKMMKTSAQGNSWFSDCECNAFLGGFDGQPNIV